MYHMSLISKNVFPGKPMTPTGGHQIAHTPPVPITAVLLSKTHCHLAIKSKQRGSWFFHKPVDLTSNKQQFIAESSLQICFSR